MRTRSSDVRPKKDSIPTASPSSALLGASNPTENTSPVRVTRKMTRTSSNMSTRSQIIVGEPDPPTSTPKQSKKKLTIHFKKPGTITFKGLTPEQFPDYVPKSDDSSSAKSSKSEVIISTNPVRETPTPELMENQDSELSDDDEFSDSDLPSPFQDKDWKPELIRPEDCADEADYEYKTRFAPITPAEKFIAAMTAKPLSEVPTSTLYALAENAQHALVAWQNQWLDCEKRANPYMKQPKPPAHQAKLAGRGFVSKAAHEALKEADLYNYVFDPKKTVQNPFTQQIGKTDASGRALRRRKEKDPELARLSRRESTPEEPEPIVRPKRRVAGRFRDSSVAPTPEPTPQLGVPQPTRGRPGRKRKSEVAIPEETPEVEEPRKRTRVTRTNAVPQRIQELRAESVAPTPDPEDIEMSDSEPQSAGEEGTPSKASTPVTEPMAATFEDTPAPEYMPKKRGRPKGSKNVNKRSDAGIKKGPRKNFAYKVDMPTPPISHADPPPLDVPAESAPVIRASSPVQTSTPTKAPSPSPAPLPVLSAIPPVAPVPVPELTPIPPPPPPAAIPPSPPHVALNNIVPAPPPPPPPVRTMVSPPSMPGKVAISRLAPQPSSPPAAPGSIDSNQSRSSATPNKQQSTKPKSAKRSEAMKKWWDERHKNQAAQRAAEQHHTNAPPPRDGTPINLGATILPSPSGPPHATLPPINTSVGPFQLQPPIHSHGAPPPPRPQAPSASPTYSLPQPPSRPTSTTPFVAHSHPPILAPAPSPGPGAAGQMSTLNFAPAGNGRGRGSRGGGRGRGGRGGGRGRGRGRGGFQNSTVESMAAAAAHARAEARRSSG